MAVNPLFTKFNSELRLDEVMAQDLEGTIGKLTLLHENLQGKTLETLDTQRLTQLFDKITEFTKNDCNMLHFERFGQIIWNLSFAIILNYPKALNWPLAIRLSDCFSSVNKDIISQQPLFRMEVVREATIASKSQPDIPKAFATLLIALVSQNYLTINDLESHALALLHFEWTKNELLFIEKCLTEIKAMLVAKLTNESELQLIIDWIAETVAAMVADIEA